MRGAPARGNRLPHTGVMTHADDTGHAQARRVARMVRRARGMTVHTDRDPRLRNAFATAVVDWIRADRGEMASVRFHKERTIDAPRDLSRLSERRVQQTGAANGLDPPRAIARAVGLECMPAGGTELTPIDRRGPTARDVIDEPRRRILSRTDTGRTVRVHGGWARAGAGAAPAHTDVMRLRPQGAPPRAPGSHPRHRAPAAERRPRPRPATRGAASRHLPRLRELPLDLEG